MNDQGKITDAPAFDATRFVLPALLSITLYLSIIVISSMTMVKPAHASGTVPRTTLWCSHESNPATCTYSTREAACFALAAANPYFNHNPFVLWSGGWFVGYICYGHPASSPNDHYWAQRLGWLAQGGACPSNSAPTNAASCICNTGYVPDPTATSCVPTCPIDPLPKPPPPFSDACSNSLESGRGVDVDNACVTGLTDDMKKGASCLADKIHALAIPYTGPSATIRTEAYQQHLVDIWDKSKEIKKKVVSDADKQACAVTIADVEAEKERHGIKAPPSKNGDKAPHVLGNALDIPGDVVDAMMAKVTTSPTIYKPCLMCPEIMLPATDVQDYVNSATDNPPACNLRWGGRFTPYDPVHYQLP